MSKDLSQLSFEELDKKQKNTGALLGLLMGVGLTLLGLTLYRSYEEGSFDSTMIIVLCCLAALPFSWKELKAVKAEIAKRKENSSSVS